MKPARIRNRHVGPLTFSVGLRKDGGRNVEVSSDWRDGGPVVLALITPGPIVVIFHQPTLQRLAAQYEAEEAVA